jgi:nucleotide-binding universal stress UspA family protein
MQQHCLKRSLPFERVVAALGDDPDPDLIRYVARLAGREDQMEIRFIQILEQTANVARTLLKLRESVEGQFGARPGRRKIRCNAAYGQGIQGILDAATDVRADVIVVRKRNGREADLRHCLRHSCRAVWVLPEGPIPEPGRVLAVAGDLPDSTAGLEAAAAISRHWGIQECVVLRPYFNESGHDCSHCEREAQWSAEQACCHLVAQFDSLGIHFRPAVEQSSVLANSIERAAAREGASLIVITSPSCTPTAAALLNGGIEKTVEHLSVPVLVVRQAGKKIDFLSALKCIRRRPEPQFG